MAHFRTSYHDRFGDYMVFILGIGAFVLLMLSSASVSLFKDGHANYELRHDSIAQFSEMTSSERKAVAQSILDLSQLGLADLSRFGGMPDDDEVVRAALQDVATTGGSLRLDDIYEMQSNWSNFWLVYAPIAMAIVLAVVGLCGFLMYMLDARQGRYYLVDFPFQRRSHRAIFLALTILPIGWLFYAISYVRYRRASTLAADMMVIEEQ